MSLGMAVLVGSIAAGCGGGQADAGDARGVPDSMSNSASDREVQAGTVGGTERTRMKLLVDAADNIYVLGIGITLLLIAIRTSAARWWRGGQASAARRTLPA